MSKNNSRIELLIIMSDRCNYMVRMKTVKICSKIIIDKQL
jgi:hypothetical protein